MSDYTAKFYSQALVLQHTTTNVVGGRGTWVKSGVGSGQLTFPAQDIDTVTAALNRGHIVHVYTVRSAETHTVALFVIQESRFTIAPSGEELVTISGPGMEQMIGYHLVDGEIHDGSHGPATDDVSQIVAFNPDWDLSLSSATGTVSGTRHIFKNATVIQALKATAEQSGEMWRIERIDQPAKEIRWLVVPTSEVSWNFELFYDADSYSELSADGVIISLQRGYDRSEIVTRCYVYGSGQGDERVTMLGATYTPPAGFTLYDSASLLVNDTLEAAGHYVEREVNFSDVSLPKLEFAIKEIIPLHQFVISGDHTTLFTNGYVFEVEDNSDITDGSQFTVSSSSYNSTDNETTITVIEDAATTASDGYIVPTSATVDAAQEAAANALARTAYQWLKDHSSNERYHRIRAFYPGNAQPGHKVKIVYSRGGLSINEVHQVIEVTYSIDRATGIRYADFVTAPLGSNRPRQTEEVIAGKLMATMQDLVKFGPSGRLSNTGTIVPTMEQHLAAQDPHPTYLLADGGRALVGNLSVSAGVTIDGVDLSAHAADGDIHADHTTISVVAGSGLTGGGTIAANRTLNVGAGDGIDVAADSVAVDVTDLVGSGLVEEATNNLAVGAGAGITVNANDVALTTPGTLSVSSGNVATGSHTHAITASAAPGVAASLLKTTAAGLLSLQTLELTGGALQADNYAAGTTGWAVAYSGAAEFNTSLDVNGPLSVSGGDVEFGTSFIWDYTQGAVGIGGNPGIATWPDPQFALDVNGSMRAWGYIVGKHALQIPDAQHIFHFDGPPGNADYTGVLQSHRGLTPSGDPAATFRPGLYGKALASAPSSTNLVSNPSFELGTSPWNGAGGSSLSQSTAKEPRYGTYVLGINPPGGARVYANLAGGSRISVTGGAGYTLSAWQHANIGSNLRLEIVWFDSGGASVGTAESVEKPAANEWVYYELAATAPGTAATAEIRIGDTISSVATSARIWVDGVQFEQSDYATLYLDGSMPNCDWNGTAHASTSARTAEVLDYDTGVDFTLRGSVTCWLYREDWSVTTGVVGGAFDARADADNTVRSYISATGDLVVEYRGQATSILHTVAASSLSAGWHHVAITWDFEGTNTNVAVYLDGVQETSSAVASPLSSNPSTMRIGSLSYSNLPFNGLIDDLLLVDRALDADEVRAIYESNAPVFAETSTFSWHDPTLSIRVDDTGLFARSNDADAEAVFGLATQAVTWGGQSMDVGDLMLGNANTGSANIFWDRSAGTFAFRGGATTQAYLDTSGKLWAAGGSAVFSEEGLNLRGALHLEFQRRDNVNALAGVTDANGFHIINLRGGSTELVSNGNFEDGVSGWSWDGTSGSIAQSAAEAFLGDYSLLLNYTELGALQSEYAMSDSFAISGSNLYLSLAAKGDPDAASLVIEWRDSGNSFISRSTQPISISSTWKTFSMYASIPGTAAYARVGVRGESGSPYGAHNIYIDDVSARTFGADIRTIEMLDGFGSGDLASASSIVLTADAIVADGELVTTGDLSLTSASGSRLATFSISVADLTLDTDLKFPTDTDGVILVDRTTGTGYRLYVDSGSLAIESI